MGEPISVNFCTTTRLTDVMIYSERFLNTFNRFVFTWGSNFPLFYMSMSIINLYSTSLLRCVYSMVTLEQVRLQQLSETITAERRVTKNA